MTQLNQREIKLTHCDTNGRKVDPAKCPHHYYVIITKNKYNEHCSEILGVPITSQADSEYTLNFGVDITNEDIDGDFKFDKPSFVLCDRPCRVCKTDLKQVPDNTRVTEQKFTQILGSISLFMRHGITKY